MSEPKIELIPLNQIIPLEYNVCKMNSDVELMLKNDMTRFREI